MTVIEKKSLKEIMHAFPPNAQYGHTLRITTQGVMNFFLILDDPLQPIIILYLVCQIYAWG